MLKYYNKLFRQIGIYTFPILFTNILMAESKIKYSYHYDANGNNIVLNKIIKQQDQTKTINQYVYHYNSLNQMVGFTNVQNNEYYGYDYYPNGKRSSKYTSSQTGTESIEFLYGHKGNLLNAEYSHNNQLKKRSSYFAGIRFVDDLINSNDSIFQLPLADRHNHPATISFSQGQSQIQSYHLTDYGQLSQANSNETNQATQNMIDFSLNPKVYGSGYYDPESKLQYMGARYYSADSHRFMAQDSYNLLNRYNYANANPVMNYDPDGHMSISNKGITYGLNIATIAISSAAIMNPEVGGLLLIGSGADFLASATSLTLAITSDKTHPMSKKGKKIINNFKLTADILSSIGFASSAIKTPALIDIFRPKHTDYRLFATEAEELIKHTNGEKLTQHITAKIKEVLEITKNTGNSKKLIIVLDLDRTVEEMGRFDDKFIQTLIQFQENNPNVTFNVVSINPFFPKKFITKKLKGLVRREDIFNFYDITKANKPKFIVDKYKSNSNVLLIDDTNYIDEINDLDPKNKNDPWCFQIQKVWKSQVD